MYAAHRGVRKQRLLRYGVIRYGVIRYGVNSK